jgi:hypothetical protein
MPPRTSETLLGEFLDDESGAPSPVTYPTVQEINEKYAGRSNVGYRQPPANAPAPAGLPEPSTASTEKFTDEQQLGGYVEPDPAKSPFVQSFAGLRQQMDDMFAEWRATLLGGQQRAKRWEQFVAETLTDEEARVEKFRAEHPGVEPPTPAEVPEAPSRRVRPFLEGTKGESWQQTANRTLFGLGLMANLMIGPPHAALNAFAGALNGWAEGDQTRAENDWKRYLANVEAIKLRWQRAKDRFEMIQQRYGHDLDQLRIESGIAAARMNLGRFMQEAAFKYPEQLGKLIGDQINATATLVSAAANLELKREMELSRLQHQKFLEQLGLLRLLIAQQNAARLAKGQQIGATGNEFVNARGEHAPSDMLVGDAPNAPGDKGGPYFRLSAREAAALPKIVSASQKLQNLTNLAMQLRDKGGFRGEGAFKGALQTPRLAYERTFGDPAGVGGLLNAWDGTKSELVGLYRELANEIGMRAASIVQPQLTSMTPNAGFPTVMRQLRNLDNLMRQEVKATRYPEVLHDVPPFPDLLELGDPRYKRLTEAWNDPAKRQTLVQKVYEKVPDRAKADEIVKAGKDRVIETLTDTIVLR